MIERVLDAIGTIDDELLERVSAARWAAENAPPLRTKKSEKRRLLLWAAGACACLLALAAVLSLLHCRDGRLPEDQEIAVKDSAESKNAAERIAKNTEGETRGTEPALPKSSETEIGPTETAGNETRTESEGAERHNEAIPTEVTKEETSPEPPETESGSTEERVVRVIWAEDIQGKETGKSSYTQVNGKNCVMRLYTAMNAAENDGCLFAVAALPPAPLFAEPDFAYRGKTIAEYAAALNEPQRYLNRLSLLLKNGNELIYGTVLYEEGTPNGVKWTKQYYDSVVGQIGQELLDRYLVDGRFLQEKLEADIAETEAALAENCTEAKKQYDEACAAYRRGKVLAAIPEGADGEIREDGTGVWFLTAEVFRKLDFPGIENWIFDLAQRDGLDDRRNEAQPM